METRAVEVRVTGLVQGVFFRAQCADEAVRRGVTGWVRNEYDGSVRARFEGADEAVDAMVAWCHAGSRRAVVERVDVADVPVEGLTRFATE